MIENGKWQIENGKCGMGKWQIKIILMNLLPIAHTVAKPNRNEKIILILIAAVYRD